MLASGPFPRNLSNSPLPLRKRDRVLHGESVEFLKILSAPVAQLDRASASGAEGHRFNSCQAHHTVSSSRWAVSSVGRAADS